MISPEYIKHPRIAHVPWSNPSSDDVVATDMKVFDNQKVVATLKYDGENTTIYSDGYYHARSLSGRGGPDRSYVAELAGILKLELPSGWRVCGENVYAKHSIHYSNLDSYFYVFSIWNENNMCLSYEDTVAYCQLLNLHHVDVLYYGLYDENKLKALIQDHYKGNFMEGYVIRNAAEFAYKNTAQNLCKYVRPNHVQTDKHWRNQPIVANQLKKQL